MIQEIIHPLIYKRLILHLNAIGVLILFVFVLGVIINCSFVFTVLIIFS